MDAVGLLSWVIDKLSCYDYVTIQLLHYYDFENSGYCQGKLMISVAPSGLCRPSIGIEIP